MMSGDYLTAPGLLAHVFLAAGGQDAPAEWARLRTLWRDVTGHLGLDQPVRLPGVPRHLPEQAGRGAGSGAGTSLLAAADRGGPSVWQAYAWAGHGVLGLTAMMAPPRDRDCARGWAALEQTWKQAVAGLAPEGVLGEVRILLALVARPPGAGPATGEGTSGLALDLVRAAVPEPSSAGWWRHWDAVSPGSPAGEPSEVLVWETGPESGDARRVRRLAAVAPAESERQVDRFLWTSGDGTATPLARHLLHAARLRYQIRVFDDGRPARRVRDELGLLADDLSGAPAGAGALAPDPADRDRLPARLEHAHGAALTLRARLDAMRHAVGVIGENLRGALSLPATDPAVGPLSDDRQLAAWFGQRLDDEVSRLDAAVAHARSARSSLPGAATVPGPATSAPGHAGANGRTSLVLQDPWSQRRARPRAPQVVVFTALEVEYLAIRAYLTGPVRQQEERGTLYELGALPGAGGSWRVAVTQTGPGSTSAGVHLERAVSVFAPDIVLFLGVAGGRKDVVRGDVVVADTIYDYEWGKSTREGYEPRMRTHFPAYRLLQRARLVAREDRWQQRIWPACPQPPPAAFVKPIVTGGKVVAHNQSEVARLLDQYASDALAVETEGHGFLEGAYVNPGVDALVIRGISDLLARKNTASDNHWQPVASRHAAAFAVELLDTADPSHA